MESGQKMRGKRIASVGLAIACALLAIAAEDMTPNTAGAIADGKMKTVCVGRFLIDLPVEAEVTIRGGFVGGFDVSEIPESDENYRNRLRRMEEEVGATRDELGENSLEWSKTLQFGVAAGKVAVFDRQRAQGLDGGRIIEAEDFSVRGMLRFPNVSVAAEAKRQGVERGEELARLFARLTLLSEAGVHREPGFCLGHTFVRDPYESAETESVVMSAALPRHPDVHIVLYSMAGTDPAPGLLARNAKSAKREPLYMRLAFTTLRERQRIVHTLVGEELVLKVREPNLTTGYSMQFEVTGKQHDVYAPLLALELGSGTNSVIGGKPVQSSLSEGAVLKLWDRIASSVRVRPVGNAHRLPARTLGMNMRSHPPAGATPSLGGMSSSESLSAHVKSRAWWSNET
ncbi:T6SS immunity protein Tli4 family protein [Massilia yuzhufengensis]|uniref:Tle cognate immunity protein 4 C-terminal domain-containing protein n=1 Tax=Massilia yuzhufengensis TaxID=1164594 RepID=A0A1I1U644_9BURK|nr:T6SS immunity protein Tli4 family protein [Massilia yuzhufengensis]SFD66249.1 hypothetical protein SAMN05216204_13215 [Massilia yuzhufengensis]